MSLIEALVLGVVQGVTEFLPISSSGHTVLASWAFGWDAPELAFDVAIHIGTVLAVLVYFARDWVRLLRGAASGGAAALGEGGETRPADARRVLALVVLATIPVGLVGLFLRDAVDESVRQPTQVGAFLMCTGVFLALGERLGRRQTDVADLTPLRAAAVGIAQAAAVLPGISRAGASITAGVLGGMKREAAARFAFYLAVPAILGPGIVMIIDLARGEETAASGIGVLIAGGAMSFITGLVAIRALMRILRRGNLWPFAGYCLIVGAAVLIARAAGA